MKELFQMRDGMVKEFPYEKGALFPFKHNKRSGPIDLVDLKFGN